jgi:hypothetical protein
MVKNIKDQEEMRAQRTEKSAKDTLNEKKCTGKQYI